MSTKASQNDAINESVIHDTAEECNEDTLDIGRPSFGDDLIEKAPPQPPTNKKELLAWIIYDFASGVFPSVGMQVFIPLILDQLARIVGRVPGTFDTPCAAGGQVDIAQNSTVTDPTPQGQASPCEVSLGAFYVPTVSFVLYVSALSVILQAFTFISLGALADYSNWRKKLLFIFSILASITAILFLTVVNARLFWLAALYTVFGNVFYGATIVFYNAYLGVLVRNHPCVLNYKDEVVDFGKLDKELSLFGFSGKFQRMVKKITGPIKDKKKKFEPTDLLGVVSYENEGAAAEEETKFQDTKVNENPEEEQDITNAVQGSSSSLDAENLSNNLSMLSATLDDTDFDTEVKPNNEAKDVKIPNKQKNKIRDPLREHFKQKSRIENHISNTLSTHGFAASYIANLLVLFISAGIIISQSGTYGMQIAVAICGVWWLVFSTYTWIYLQPRPGPPLPKSSNIIYFSWQRTFYAFGHVKNLPNTFLYLLTYFIFSDSFNTIGQIAILFARSNANMSNAQIAIAVVLAPIGAVIGVYFWLWLCRRLKWTTKKTLTILLALGCLLPIYGLLGYIPVKNKIVFSPVLDLGFGLSSSLEMYVAVFIFGSLFAPVMSFARVLFTDVVPTGKESEFFALYEISDRGTSWVGPLVVGALANNTNGDLRIGFVYILVTLLIPICILFKIDVAKAKRQCENFTMEEEAKRKKAEIKYYEKQKERARKRQSKENVRFSNESFEMVRMESLNNMGQLSAQSELQDKKAVNNDDMSIKEPDVVKVEKKELTPTESFEVVNYSSE